MLKGIAQIKKRTEEAMASASKNRILRVKIKDGEQALLRFLTEPDEVISAEFHAVKEMTPKGEWRVLKYCSGDSSCKYCAEGLTTGEQIFLWAWCYYILHKQQNPALDKNPEAPRWKRVKVKEDIFYQEEVNAVRLFQTGPGKGHMYKTTLINYANEYGTYLDRDYKWTREGSSRDSTSYALMPKDPTPMSDKIKETMKNLPNLADVVSGKIISFDPAKKEDESEEVEELEEENGKIVAKDKELELKVEDKEDLEDLF